MKFFIKKIYFISILILPIFWINISLAKATQQYSKENISNYFSGIVALNQNNTADSFKYLNKAQSLKELHSNFNIKFIRSLVLLDKFDEAFAFSNKIWNEDNNFFEVDLLLGLNSFIKEDYITAEKHFKRLNNVYKNDLFFYQFLGNILISWTKASQNNKKESLTSFNKIPDRFNNLKLIQNSFLQCYFENEEAVDLYSKLINNEEGSFSRYNFFLVNYFLHKKQKKRSEIAINKASKNKNLTLLVRQTKLFLENNNERMAMSFFNCKNPKDAIAEIFYVIANLYSSEKNYHQSNFYLKISLLLNEKFITNKTLLAENYFLQEKYKVSEEVYQATKSIGEVYSWHASKSIATILLKTNNKETALSYLKKRFNSLKNKNFEHYYELANFYKDNKYYQESIKYYSLTLDKIKKNHFLISKILDRRGTSYEKIGKWSDAEKDLQESLKILPDQAYVLNYLAYSWKEKKINIKKSLKMLKQADDLKKNDPYITDSLGWAYFLNKNYDKAEKYLQRAVMLMPYDPVINDHYADTLWMLSKKIQARYFWNHAINLKNIEKELKDNISNKLFFGISNQL